VIGYRNALCWAGATMAVALAGMFEVIDQASMTTLLIALPIAGWMAVSERGSCPLRKGA
jgi:hypothetical protein